MRAQTRRKEAERMEGAHALRVEAMQRLVEESAGRAAEAARLEERNERLRGEVEGLEGRLEAAREREGRLGEEAEALRAELDGRAKEISQLRERLRSEADSTTAETSALTDKIAQLEKQIEDLTEELDRMKRAADDGKREAEKAEETLEQEKAVSRDLMDNLTDALSEKEALKRQVEDLKQANKMEHAKMENEVQSQLDSARAALEERSDAAEELEARIAEMEEGTRKKDGEIRRLEAEMAAELARATSAAEEEGRRAATEAAAAEARRELEAVAAEREAEISSLRSEVGGLKTELRRLEESSRRERQKAQRREGELLSQVKAMEEGLRSAEDTQLKSDAAFGELEQELIAAKSELNQLKARLEDVSAARDAAASKIDELTSYALEEKERADVLRGRVAGEVDSVRRERDGLRERLAELERERDGLREGKAAAEGEAARLGRERDEAREGKEMADAEAAGLRREIGDARRERDAALERMGAFDDRERELLGNIAALDQVRRHLHNRVMQLSGNIRVYVRVRPVIPGELTDSSVSSSSSSSSRGGGRSRRKQQQSSDTCPFFFPGICDREASSPSSTSSSSSADDPAKNVLVAVEPYKDRGGLNNRQRKWSFGFDHVFAPSHDQDDIWHATEPLVQSSVDGFNVCIFAYGQTGSGKTYTMLGDSSNPGIVTRAVGMLFAAKSDIEASGTSTVGISVELLEIYNEKVRDLLAPNSGPSGRELNLRVNSNEAVGNVLVSANSEADVSRVLALAQRRRCVKATMSNAESSRSHMIFTVHFEVTNRENGFTRSGKLHVCDLAGSERLSKSGSMGALLKETKCINTSLAVLSNVIEKLQAGVRHVPYRESKLTYLLKNSLGGDSKTLAIVCCNPLAAHFNESLCSLRFAAKVNRVELKATGNFSC